MAATSTDRTLAALALFEEAIEWPAGERTQRLHAACAGDADLLASVERLLLLDQGAAALLPTEPVRALAADEARVLSRMDAVPEHVGPYRLTRLLGAGGMGMVWQGERDDGLFEQTVAVKFVRSGVLAAGIAERFADERRLLARLSHPNIARLYDGGSDDAGRAYLVMEYVDGVAITDYATARKLTIPARLELFAAVCAAVQSAHQNLVVHADIKPANVLVTSSGVAKLLDFGIARLQSDANANDLGDAGPLTRAFAAPERLAGQAPTVAGDVYALGALLHLLLVGELPGASPQLAHATQLDVDLQSILRTALHADPLRRYATVAALEGDLQRYREYLPLLARASAGNGYRIGKFVRRHRVAVAASVGLMFVLTAASAISTLQYLRAERARADADARFEQTRRMADYMIFEVDAELARLPGTLPLRQAMVSRSHNYLQTLALDPRAAPDLRLDVARGYTRLARIYGFDTNGGLGDLRRARASLGAANGLLAQLARSAAPPAGLALVQAEAMLVRTNELVLAPDATKLAPALQLLQQASALYAGWLRSHPADVDAEHGLLRARLMRGRLLQYAAQPQASIAIVREALAAPRHAVHTRAQQFERDFLITAADLVLAENSEDAGRGADALAYFRKMTHDIEAISAAGRGGSDARFLHSTALAAVGRRLAAQGEEAAAVVQYERSLTELRDLLRLGPNAAIEQSLAVEASRLAAVYARMHNAPRARSLGDESVAIVDRHVRAAPNDGARVRLRALVLYTRAQVERRLSAGGGCVHTRAAASAWADVQHRFGLLAMDAEPDGAVALLREWTARCADAGR